MKPETRAAWRIVTKALEKVKASLSRHEEIQKAAAIVEAELSAPAGRARQMRLRLAR